MRGGSLGWLILLLLAQVVPTFLYTWLNAEMYTKDVIAIVERAKVIGVCTAVNMFVELVGTLYSCKFHRTLRCQVVAMG